MILKNIIILNKLMKEVFIMPRNIKDEHKWEKAKEIVEEEYEIKEEDDEDKYYRLVMGTYKKMYGEFNKKEEKEDNNENKSR